MTAKFKGRSKKKRVQTFQYTTWISSFLRKSGPACRFETCPGRSRPVTSRERRNLTRSEFMTRWWCFIGGLKREVPSRVVTVFRDLAANAMLILHGLTAPERPLFTYTLNLFGLNPGDARIWSAVAYRLHRHSDFFAGRQVFNLLPGPGTPAIWQPMHNMRRCDMRSVR